MGIPNRINQLGNRSNAEIVQLRVRVIALENLLIALLADASARQLANVREMAEFIAPRAGRTHHPLTISAATHMLGLLHRAGHFRTEDSSAMKADTIDQDV